MQSCRYILILIFFHCRNKFADSVLLNIPLGAMIIILLGISVYISRCFNEIAYIGAGFTAISMIGMIFLLVLPLGGVQLLGLYLCGTNSTYNLLQTSISNNVSGYTKKIFYTAANMVAYCIGNFVGPLMMVQKQAPRYTGGLVGYIVADFLVIILFLFVRFTYARENRRRLSLKEQGMVPPRPENREELDLTDKEDLNFLYRL